MKKKLVWMIEFEPGSEFQAEQKSIIDNILTILKIQIESRHRDNVFTVKFMESEKSLAKK